MKRNWLVVFLMSAFSALTVAHGAVIYLKDGSQMEGTVVSATAQDVQLHTAEGLITVTTDRISKIDYSDAATPSRPDTTPAAPPMVTSEPPRRHRAYREPQPSIDLDDMRNMFSFNLGLAAPLSKIDLSAAGGGSGNNGDGGFAIGTEYLYFISPRFGTGLHMEYFNRSDNVSHGLLPAADTSVSGNTLLLMGVARYSLIDRGSTRPYILAGIGANRTSTNIEATPVQGFSWSDTDSGETRTLVDESRWGPAYTLRLGMDFHWMDPTVFSIEAGWTGISNGRYQPTVAGSDLGIDNVTGHLDVFNLSARWGWRF